MRLSCQNGQTQYQNFQSTTVQAAAARAFKKIKLHSDHNDINISEPNNVRKTTLVLFFKPFPFDPCWQKGNNVAGI